ncbi:MAG: family 10 glycosylhydrolase [Pirellulaceae bacterium]
MPESVKKYGQYLWMDLGSQQAAALSLAVFNDVVRRYDIDGVHIDDYFYPYPITEDGAKVPFPDDDSWAKYRAAEVNWSGMIGTRQNINHLIEQIYQTTHAIKPHVRFGISPFGIGRAGKAPGITGFDQYEGSMQMPLCGSTKAGATTSLRNSIGRSHKSHRAFRYYSIIGKARTGNRVTFGRGCSLVASVISDALNAGDPRTD